jgi:hypothetical protein
MILVLLGAFRVVFLARVPGLSEDFALNTGLFLIGALGVAECVR